MTSRTGDILCLKRWFAFPEDHQLPQELHGGDGCKAAVQCPPGRRKSEVLKRHELKTENWKRATLEDHSLPFR